MHFSDIFLRLHLSHTGSVWSHAILALRHGSQACRLPFRRLGKGVPSPLRDDITRAGDGNCIKEIKMGGRTENFGLDEEDRHVAD